MRSTIASTPAVCALCGLEAGLPGADSPAVARELGWLPFYDAEDAAVPHLWLCAECRPAWPEPAEPAHAGPWALAASFLAAALWAAAAWWIFS